MLGIGVRECDGARATIDIMYDKDVPLSQGQNFLALALTLHICWGAFTVTWRYLLLGVECYQLHAQPGSVSKSALLMSVLILLEIVVQKG